MRKFGLSALTLFLLAMPLTAHATWLDLADGTYDVTLTCKFSSVIACPSQITGTMTISGTGASAMNFTVNGQLFAGDPTDSIFAIPNLVDDQLTEIDLSPFAFLALRNDLTIPNPFGLSDHFWIYCNTFDVNHCTPNTDGDWTATLASSVPEPALAAWLTVVLGLVTAAGVARQNASAFRRERLSRLTAAPAPTPYPPPTTARR